jgi:GDP-4-dehydro-6-deoxy-D-mannose reductase
VSPARIFVTGAEGFVGGHLLAALRQAFPAAVLLGMDETRLDVTDRAATFAGIARHAPDVCIHLAAISAIAMAAADPARAWNVNLFGAINVAEAILAGAPDCRLLFVSTAEVYGGTFRAGAALDETAPLAPMNLYAATKAAAEMALAALVPGGLRLMRLRPFNHTGPGQTEAFVVPAFAAQIARAEAGLQPPVIAVGALTPERDFLDVRDVCAAYVACIECFDTLAANAVLNIASGTAVSIGSVLERLLGLATRRIETAVDPARLRPVEIARALGDANEAARRLGWRPRFTLNETLQAVLDDARRTVVA